ncbi:DNA mismatch repair protein MutL [Varanus komodoensis]|nr:DNA mismatch repair protein MutL [Varanus komodoensis]
MECRTRNNQLKLRQPRFRLDIRKSFLPVRAMRLWNQLPGEVVGFPTLKTFGKKLDSHLSELLLDLRKEDSLIIKCNEWLGCYILFIRLQWHHRLK